MWPIRIGRSHHGTGSAKSLPQRLEHRDRVDHRCFCLNVMYEAENVAAARCEDLTTPQYLLPNFLRSAEWEHSLGIDAAAPEYDAVTVGSFQRFGIHPGSRALHRVQDVESGFYEGRDELRDSAARVLERPPLRVLVNPVIHSLVVRHPKLAESRDRTE